MKNIVIYNNAKYYGDEYRRLGNGIFQLGDTYTTSLSFEQEPAWGEGDNSSKISQYPLEDILDYFGVYVSDFYEELNDGSSNICCLEFAGPSLESIQELLGIVGKHVYIKKQAEGKRYIEKLCIE